MLVIRKAWIGLLFLSSSQKLGRSGSVLTFKAGSGSVLRPIQIQNTASSGYFFVYRILFTVTLFFTPGSQSAFKIRIRIQQLIEYRSKTDPEPKACFLKAPERDVMIKELKTRWWPLF